MTTISHRRRRRITPRQLLIYAVVGLLLIVLVVFLRSPLASVVWRALEPVLGLRAVGEVLSAPFHSNLALMQENARLRADLASSTYALADRNMLYQETLGLKSRLGRVPSGETSILAGVLLAPPATPYDTLVIDAGKGEGVRMGALISPGGTLIVGRVSEVYASSARVTLFSAPGESHEGLLRGSVPVSVVGEGAGSMSAQLPAGTEAKVGDWVVLPGIAQGVSATVVSIETKEGGTFSTLHLSLPVNIFTLRYVEVRSTPTLYEAP